MLNKEMAKLNFDNKASEIQNLCNGLNPWPICYVVFNAETGEKLKVYKAKPYLNIPQDLDLNSFKNGQVVLSSAKTGLVVKCADGLVLLDLIQAPNSKAMPSKAYLNGKSIEVGKMFN
jgi:methionyl-tRNA formyltransferase